MENPSLFMMIWPWIGLGAAIVLLIILFATDWLRSSKGESRWTDPTWFAWLAAVAYMLHNGEEYGIDAMGASLGFPEMMATSMQVAPPESFFLTVNLGLVWIAGPLAALFSRKYPVLALAMPTVELVNCFLHIPGAIAMQFIGAGLMTAVFLFVPIAIWAVVGLCGKGRLKRTWYLAFVGIAVVYHIGFVATIVPLILGVAPGFLPALTMAAFTVLMLLLWCLMAKRSKKARQAFSKEASASTAYRCRTKEEG